jgi:hypothetical protein
MLIKIHTLSTSNSSLSAKMSSVSEDTDLYRSFALSAVSLNAVNEKKIMKHKKLEKKV